MKRLLTLLITLMFVCVAFGQSSTTQNFKIIRTSPKLYFVGQGGVIDFLNGSAHITLTQSVNTLTLAGGDFALGANNITMTGSIGATGARVTKGWFADAEFTNTPTIGGVALSSTYATIASVNAITASSIGLGNVNNVSQATMFTNPDFTGTRVRLGSDTLATRAYARSEGGGGGGGGGGTWGSITGTLSAQTDLQNALNAKLATNGSAASLTNFPTLNQSTTGSAAKWTTPRSIWGNSIDGSGNITSIIASTYGGTGNGFTKFSGASITEKTYTLPDASATILTNNTAVTVPQGGTGRATSTTAYGLLAAGTTATGAQQTLSTGSAGQVLRSGGSGALPVFSTATYPATSGTTRTVLMSDGTNFVSSTETFAAPGTSGNVPLSDGTNWTSSTPVEGLPKDISVNAQTGSNYTLVLADAGKLVTMTNGSANTLTIPLNSSVAFAYGSSCAVINVACLGAGVTTVTATGGVTIVSPSSKIAITPGGGATLTKVGVNTWWLVGTLQ